MSFLDSSFSLLWNSSNQAFKHISPLPDITVGVKLLAWMVCLGSSPNLQWPWNPKRLLEFGGSLRFLRRGTKHGWCSIE